MTCQIIEKHLIYERKEQAENIEITIIFELFNYFCRMRHANADKNIIQLERMNMKCFVLELCTF